MAPRDTENNAYAKKSIMLCYGIFGVVNQRNAFDPGRDLQVTTS